MNAYDIDNLYNAACKCFIKFHAGVSKDSTGVKLEFGHNLYYEHIKAYERISSEFGYRTNFVLYNDPGAGGGVAGNLIMSIYFV